MQVQEEMKKDMQNTSRKRVIVVTPVYKEEMSREEEASIVFVQKYLQNYEKVIISPEKLRKKNAFCKFWQEKGYTVVFFKDKYFDGIAGYNALMLSVDFYKQFIDYEYILICQLDALMLSGSLDEWLDKDLDYIGPPWISEGKKLKVESAGNGGFSLRRVKAFMEVLESKKFVVPQNTFVNLPARAGVLNLLVLRLMILTGSYFKKLNRRALFLFFFSSNEDLFWSFFAQYFIKRFNVAEAEEALEFAFECEPRFCYEINKHNLPLGVHAWFKHDLLFWIEQFPELEQYAKLDREEEALPAGEKFE